MKINNKDLYIGVVGQIASGKGILVNQLTSQLGFTSFSLSSIVHEELKKRGIKNFDRKIMQDIGDEMRRREGEDVLVKRTIEQLNRFNQSSRLNRSIGRGIARNARTIIEGIRNPGEIEFLKKNKDFILIGVKANQKIRFQRVLTRGKEWDPKNYDEFLKVDKRDLGLGQGKNGQQVGKCLAYCDYIITNNKGMKDFEKKVEKLMYKIY